MNIGNKIITVTSPLLPDLEEYNTLLQDIWNRGWITNMGYYHQKLENKLASYLGVKYISLFTNGTLPLITALQALGVKEGEVITTPYSFVATSHSIWWNGLKPVFVDVLPDTGNIDPYRIEKAITDKTVAIMPVHVYGKPCDNEHIQEIADKYGLKVIYDAAHAFGVKVNGESVLNWGDMSTLSFHATKVFNTIEGGALICKTQNMKEKIDHLKNFGFEDETVVAAPGINGKMDEMRSAYGLLNLRQVDRAIEARKRVVIKYVTALREVRGVCLFPYLVEQTFSSSFTWNYAYFPILITEEYGISRDELYAKLKSANVFCRRYFYPLITTFEPYRNFLSAKVENLPIANRLADQVICLPLHHTLSEADVERVLSVIKE